MRKIIFLLLIFFSASLFAQQDNRIRNNLIVQLSGINASVYFNQHLQQNNITPVKLQCISKRLNIWTVQIDTTQINSYNAIKIINTFPEVLQVQYDHTLQLRNTVPDDASFNLQWNMLNDGSSGVADADIDADEAWQITTGGLTLRADTIVIAIVDDGFDTEHEDLNFWKNYNEIDGNGIDDDSNGYTDDFSGWNSQSHNDGIPPLLHGTHVSGIAGAIGDNEIGIAGVNWNVKIMPVVADAVESQVMEAYDFILTQRKMYNSTNGEKGSFIVATNTSFGIDLANPEYYPIWCALYDSLGQAGILSAAATANLNVNVDVVGDMPTACSSDYLIAVTNTDKSDNLSNAAYGPINIDLSAPGTLIYSTIPGNNYNYQSGTSMSSPHVAGAVALLMSAACVNFIDDYKADPAGKALLIKNYILSSVDTLPALEEKTVSNGRLNLYKAILKMESEYCTDAVHNVLPSPFDVNIFPNPAENILNIRIKNKNAATNTYQFTITDVLSRQIKTAKFISFNAEEIFSIDVSGFLPGMYFLNLYSEKQAGEEVYSSPFTIK